MYFCLLLYLDDVPNKESATEYDGSDEGIVGLNVNVFGRFGSPYAIGPLSCLSV